MLRLSSWPRLGVTWARWPHLPESSAQAYTRQAALRWQRCSDAAETLDGAETEERAVGRQRLPSTCRLLRCFAGALAMFRRVLPLGRASRLSAAMPIAAGRADRVTCVGAVLWAPAGAPNTAASSLSLMRSLQFSAKSSSFYYLCISPIAAPNCPAAPRHLCLTGEHHVLADPPPPCCAKCRIITLPRRQRPLLS